MVRSFRLGLFISLLVALSTSCKKESKSDVVSGKTKTTSAVFAPYVASFLENLALSGLNPNVSGLTVNFTTDLPANVLGSCTMGQKRVRINENLWSILSAAGREELVFHELGHCVLNRGHDNTEIAGIPVSIMNAYHLGPTIYADPTLYDGYMAELFNSPLAVFAGLTFDATPYASTLSSEDGHTVFHQTPGQPIFRCLDEEEL